MADHLVRTQGRPARVRRVEGPEAMMRFAKMAVTFAAGELDPLPGEAVASAQPVVGGRGWYMTSSALASIPVTSAAPSATSIVSCHGPISRPPTCNGR